MRGVSYLFGHKTGFSVPINTSYMYVLYLYRSVCNPPSRVVQLIARLSQEPEVRVSIPSPAIYLISPSAHQ